MNSQSKTLARKFIIFQPITAQIHNHFKYIDKISHKLTLYLQYYMHLSLLGDYSQTTFTRRCRHLVPEMQIFPQNSLKCQQGEGRWSIMAQMWSKQFLNALLCKLKTKKNTEFSNHLIWSVSAVDCFIILDYQIRFLF